MQTGTEDEAPATPHSLVRDLRAALDDEDDALRQPGTILNVFLGDAAVWSREDAERSLWDKITWDSAAARAGAGEAG